MAMVSDTFFEWVVGGGVPQRRKTHTKNGSRSPARERRTIVYMETSDSEYEVSSDDRTAKFKKVRFKECEPTKSALKKGDGKEKLSKEKDDSANQVSESEDILYIPFAN